MFCNWCWEQSNTSYSSIVCLPFPAFHREFINFPTSCQQQTAKIPPPGKKAVTAVKLCTNRFVFSKQPSSLRPGEGDGLGGECRRVNITAHQNVHFLLCLHLRLLDVRDTFRVTGRFMWDKQWFVPTLKVDFNAWRWLFLQLIVCLKPTDPTPYRAKLII